MNRRIKKSSGYSLVELALVLMISGVLMSGLADMYRVYAERRAVKQTVDNIDEVRKAVQAFYNDSKTRRYPCPAGPSYDYSTSTNAGAENCTATNGVVEISVTHADGTADSILIGSVPYLALKLQKMEGMVNISQSTSLDGWGGKLTYAVTKSQTIQTTYKNQSGGIGFQTEAGVSLVTPDESAHFVILSHGQDRKGAYSAKGSLTPCSSAVGYDQANCDRTDNIFVQGLKSGVEGATHYDDYIFAQTVTLNSLWTLEKNIVTGNYTDNIYNLNSGYVGVGMTDDLGPHPEPIERVDVNGTLAADRFWTNFICNEEENAADRICFQPSYFASGAANCNTILPPGANQYTVMTGVRNGVIECKRLNFAPTGLGVEQDCPLGESVSGIKVDGTIECAPNPLLVTYVP